jgi:hypothetical protein
MYSASSCIVPHNFHFLLACRSCMTHHQVLPATAAKTIQAPVNHVCSILLRTGYCCACQYGSTVCFLCKPHVKCSSTRKCWRKFFVNFPGTQLQARVVRGLKKKVRSSGSLVGKTPRTASCWELCKKFNILPLASQILLSLSFVVDNMEKFQTNSDIHSISMFNLQ